MEKYGSHLAPILFEALLIIAEVNLALESFRCYPLVSCQGSNKFLHICSRHLFYDYKRASVLHINRSIQPTSLTSIQITSDSAMKKIFVSLWVSFLILYTSSPSIATGTLGNSSESVHGLITSCTYIFS